MNFCFICGREAAKLAGCELAYSRLARSIRRRRRVPSGSGFVCGDPLNPCIKNTKKETCMAFFRIATPRGLHFPLVLQTRCKYYPGTRCARTWRQNCALFLSWSDTNKKNHLAVIFSISVTPRGLEPRSLP